MSTDEPDPVRHDRLEGPDGVHYLVLTVHPPVMRNSKLRAKEITLLRLSDERAFQIGVVELRREGFRIAQPVP